MITLKNNGMVKRRMINRSKLNPIFKKIWMLFAALIITIALVSSLFRSLTPWAHHYKNNIELHLSQLIGQQVTIEDLKTGWYWFHPVLKLDHLTIRGKRDSIHLGKLFVGINLLNSLVHWKLKPGLLYIKEVHLTARKMNNEWTIDGIDEQRPSITLREVLYQLTQQERLIIKNSSISLHVEKEVIPIEQINLSVVNNYGDFKIKGLAETKQKIKTKFELLATLYFDPARYKETQGTIYFYTKNFSLPQWQQLIPYSLHYFSQGTGTLALWIDLKHGEVSSSQAQLYLKQIVWHNLYKKNESIDSLSANMSWAPDSQGWKFEADQFKLKMDGKTWPENQIMLRFDPTTQAHTLFIKSIIVESLVPKIVAFWPGIEHQVKLMNPQGVLSDFKMMIKNYLPIYLLTRFDQLSWGLYDKIPAVSNLSGVLQWEPQEGHLELDSEQASLLSPPYPKQNLTLLNGVIDWKELSNGLRVSVDHFALSQPELTLSFQGVVDDIKKDSLGGMNFSLDFSGTNIQQWLPFIPKDYIKPKLFAWLNKGIKRLGQATGKIIINGALKDFPFDNKSGEFSIVSHVLGGDILISPKWKLIKDIEGYVRLKNRSLEIDIVDGDAQGVPLKQINLRVDDLGKEKETLLLHAVVLGKAQGILNFILASPLKEKLTKLTLLSIKGFLSLDLNLEIPLYPENNKDLVKAAATFKNNDILIKHQMGIFSIDEVNGTLFLNEKGVTQSALVGTAFDYPLDIKIQSITEPKPTTLISIIGECTVASLKSKLSLPLLSRFKGRFSIDALFKITADPNDLDKLTFNSSLEGLSINLPEPLGKKHKEIAPLEIDLDFNTEKTLRLKANYNKKISTDLLFQRTKAKIFELESGQISLGPIPAVDQKIKGLALTGLLDGFNLEDWNAVFTEASSTNNVLSLTNKLSAFNLKLNRLTFLNQSFDQLSVKGRILSSQDWAFNIEQKKISADLRYQRTTNLLSGFIRRMHLDKIKLDSSRTTLKIEPAQIPNLNLRVDNLSVGSISIGNLILKSHSSIDHWSIEYARIDTPAYQLFVEGDWLHKASLDQTNMQLKLQVNNLSKSLELWNITPAVDANKGSLLFKGGWKGSIFDFSLAKIKGAMYIQLNNGRITHLSPETEEKLGLGKLLSILSLQTIPRRLKLDFTDLSEGGFSFDVFKGDFDLNNGIMKTNNSYLDGPVAYASMKGNLDIVRRMYDLNLSISPHITASLPVVATIAGGPIAGLATWVASKIINKSMQKITGYSYKVSGPWHAPVVQQLSIIKNMIKII